MPTVAALTILVIMALPVAEGSTPSSRGLLAGFDANAIGQHSPAPKLLVSSGAWPRAITPAIPGDVGGHALIPGTVAVPDTVPDESMQDSFYKAIAAAQVRAAAWTEEDSYEDEGEEEDRDVTKLEATLNDTREIPPKSVSASRAGRFFSPTRRPPERLQKEPVAAIVETGEESEWLSGSFLLQLTLLAALAVLVFLICLGLQIATAALARWSANNNADRVDGAGDRGAEPSDLSCIPSPTITTFCDPAFSKPYLAPEMV